MPQQTDSATRKSLNQIDDSLEGQKLRVAGRVLAYDVQTGLIILIDKQHGLLVDVDLSLHEESAEWATERLSTIMVIGHLERSSVGILSFHTPSASEASALTSEVLNDRHPSLFPPCHQTRRDCK
ncbi:hypothetical protein BJ912DRAFT_843718 [Pholiota molesta]|nr:hypothetical protein BJ912DRAFT_843718 [Pholiota molesta]